MNQIIFSIVVISVPLFGGYFLGLRNSEYIWFCCFSFVFYIMGFLGCILEKTT